jgi:hypothetical protein
MIYEANDTVYITAHEDHLARYYCAWKVRVGQELMGVCCYKYFSNEELFQCFLCYSCKD